MSFYSKLYRIQNHRIRGHIRKWISKREKGEFNSKSLREIFEIYYNVRIGKYTYGGCFVPGEFDPKTTIGNYCSIAMGVKVFNRNHPYEQFSTHPYFYNSRLKYVDSDRVEFKPLTIGHDVWIGHSAMITPNVNTIGNGAIVGAGSIVTKDIPPYAIVAGNPAKIIKYRFDEEKIKHLESIKWWEMDIEQLLSQDFDSIIK